MDNKIVIYQSDDNEPEIQVKLENDTVWLNRTQLAELFGRDIKTIGKHINNSLAEELADISVVAKFATTATDGKTYQTEHYNLDMILSVGYRVKSSEGIKFRIWANQKLKEYLVKGVAVNHKRLEQLGKMLDIVSRSDIAEVAGVGEVVGQYVHALYLLEEYDENTLSEPKGRKSDWKLTYNDARNFLDILKNIEGFNDNFASERSDHIKGIVAGLYQTFDSNELYESVEEKAANLLYQVVKDHPFFDGNKRSGAALFIYFLAKSGIKHDINSNGLAAITLMTALSNPSEKDQIILLIRNFLVSSR